MRSEGLRRLSPVDARSCGQREPDLLTHFYPSSDTGEHGIWCDLIFVEVGFRPLEARNLELGITRSKVFLRVAATGFTFTIHVRDVAQVRHVIPAHAIELHVEVPSAASPDDHSHRSREKSCTVATNRLYRVYPKESGFGSSNACEQLFQLITSILPAHVQQVSEESDLDDAVAWYERVDACSMLAYYLSEEVGLRELGSVSHFSPHSCSLASRSRSAALHSESQLHSSARRQARSARSLTSSCRGFPAPSNLLDDVDRSASPSLHRIYVAPSPSFWRLPKAFSPLTRSHCLSHERGTPPRPHRDVAAEVASTSAAPLTFTKQRQHTLRLTPESTSTFFAVTAPTLAHQPHPVETRSQQPTHSSRDAGVSMRRRASSLTARMCGLRRHHGTKTVISIVFTAQSSWRHPQQSVAIEYGPTTSG
ncbi:hypothetical protein, conserved [Leishmania tarentolae]|uniref:Uncharacterized protein n=1 Tax=Leishmania tarentolae TaxID=5689 RepID=A0A640KIP4_LEITA|nr:hypothetical protein, conserved [Leishmania tarentolae]